MRKSKFKGTPERAAFDSSSFFASLDATRQERGLQWRQVAEAAGISASTLTRLAQGKRPDVDGFAALITWSGLDANDFVAPGDQTAAPVASAMAALFRANRQLKDTERDALTKLVQSAYDLATRGTKK